MAILVLKGRPPPPVGSGNYPISIDDLFAGQIRVPQGLTACAFFLHGLTFRNKLAGMRQLERFMGFSFCLLAAPAFATCSGGGGADDVTTDPDVVEQAEQDVLPDMAVDEGPDNALRLESGRYVVEELFGHDPVDEDLLMAIEMVLDRDAGTVVFELQDGTHVTANLSIRADLLGCCCTMDDCLWGEVADMDVDPLVLESMSFAVPILVVSLYDANGEVLLREDDGSFDLYAYADVKHILFTPAP
jgi:hypothetical protein